MRTEIGTETIWQKSKLLIKGLMIGGLVLVLLIPTLFVTNLIAEREARQQEAIREVSSKWAGAQNIAGPVLVLPYLQTASSDSAGRTVRQRQQAYFLPDELNVAAQINPQEKSRGIFKIMLYDVHNNLSGRFDSIPFEKLNLDPASVLWNEAFVQVTLSDPKGLNEELQLQWNDRKLLFSAAGQDGQGSSRMQAPLKLNGPADVRGIRFSGRMHLNGSQSFYLTPVGKATTLTVRSAWPHPSFAGAVLPQQTAVRDTGFEATWKSMAHKRSFPQQWRNSPYEAGVPATNNNYAISVAPAKEGTEAGYNLGHDAFGVDLFIPVNGYQKTLRSIKYAVLCILLTFCAFFLVETAHKRAVHPFQYALIGVALVLFYLLLLSFSEYIGFNGAYAVATIATVALIGWFVRGLLGSGRLSTLLSLVLVLLYSFVFTILQLQDFALLLGSIGLFITLGVVMYYSRKFQW